MVQNIIGMPTATIEEDLATLELNIRLRADYAWCSIFTPYPGTELGDMCVKEKYYSGDYSEIGDSFFEKSVLNFREEHKEMLVCLQRIFALAVETQCMPSIKELQKDRLFQYVHRAMRKLGDERLYGGVVV